MKMNQMFAGLLGDGEMVAYFGQARLVRRLDGKFELRGGSHDDHSAAKEWISLFMHEAVLVETVTPAATATKLAGNLSSRLACTSQMKPRTCSQS